MKILQSTVAPMAGGILVAAPATARSTSSNKTARADGKNHRTETCLANICAAEALAPPNVGHPKARTMAAA